MTRNTRNKLSQEEVIKRFVEVHGDKYDYSRVKYVPNIWFGGVNECFSKLNVL